MSEQVRVAVAVIEDSRGQILIARRPQGVHQGGLWEFPGGKVEPEEDLEQALAREVWEELGIEVRSHRPLIRITHRYADRVVVLDVHRVTEFRGVPEGREGQPLAWCTPDELGGFPMPAADRPVISALRLPSAYVITGPCLEGEQAFLVQAEQVLRRGYRLLQLRAPGVTRRVYRSYAEKLLELCHAWGASLLLNAPAKEVLACGAHGVHLSSARLLATQTRPLPADRWVAASCHSKHELKWAQKIGVDFAVLSPVLATASHPHANPLGWRGFQQQVEGVPFPVYALGGMTPALMERAWEMGGQGIAAIRGLWYG